MLHVSAALLATAAFEAYLNFVGQAILPEVWKSERSFFSSANYRGTFGKLKRIAEELNYVLPSTGRRPYSGARELQSLRDKLVHARPKRENYSVLHREDKWPRLPVAWLRKEAPVAKVIRLIIDTEELASGVHHALLVSRHTTTAFGPHPFFGALSTASGIRRDAG